MSIVSLTFHCPATTLNAWEIYSKNELLQMVQNLMDVEKFILSDVQTEMIEEGRNSNLLLVFENDEMRDTFLENELANIAERIEQKFGDEIMIFKTFLNPYSARF